jgi:hypothetical protein
VLLSSHLLGESRPMGAIGSDHRGAGRHRRQGSVTNCWPTAGKLVAASARAAAGPRCATPGLHPRETGDGAFVVRRGPEAVGRAAVRDGRAWRHRLVGPAEGCPGLESSSST